MQSLPIVHACHLVVGDPDLPELRWLSTREITHVALELVVAHGGRPRAPSRRSRGTRECFRAGSSAITSTGSAVLTPRNTGLKEDSDGHHTGPGGSRTGRRPK